MADVTYLADGRCPLVNGLCDSLCVRVSVCASQRVYESGLCMRVMQMHCVCEWIMYVSELCMQDECVCASMSA